MSFTTHSLLPLFLSAKSWGTRVIQIRSRYVWTGKFDLNPDTCRRENICIRKENVVDSKIPGYVWRGLKQVNYDKTAKKRPAFYRYFRRLSRFSLGDFMEKRKALAKQNNWTLTQEFWSLETGQSMLLGCLKSEVSIRRELNVLFFSCSSQVN